MSSSFNDMHLQTLDHRWYPISKVFGPWASPHPANGRVIITLYYYRCRQLAATSNDVNPSLVSFCTPRSVNPMVPEVFAPCGSSYGPNGQVTMALHNRENPSNSSKDICSRSLKPTACPERHDNKWQVYFCCNWMPNFEDRNITSKVPPFHIIVELSMLRIDTELTKNKWFDINKIRQA